MPAQLRRQLKPGEVICPAGEQVRDADCYCHVEKVLIDGRLNPSTIEGYCTGTNALGGNYQFCPTWRAEKEMFWRTGRGIDLEPADVERHDIEVQQVEKTVDPERPYADYTVGDGE